MMFHTTIYMKMFLSWCVFLQLSVPGLVTEALENLALNAVAKSSSVYPYVSSYPRNAVDGNTDANHNHGSCFHSLGVPGTTDPWWMVDLGQLSLIENVFITNRGDGYTEKLRNFSIQMSETLMADQVTLRYPSLCYLYQPNPAGLTVNFTCPAPVLARYVKIQLHHDNAILQLCEVEVWGSKDVEFGGTGCYRYKHIPGRKSSDMIIQEVQSPITLLGCTTRCLKTQNCHSFNIKLDDDGNVCQLLEDVRERGIGDIIHENNWKYFKPVFN